MINLYLEAPFAVFRTFTAGSFRPTAGFITHSAAYGLILNIARVDMRRYDETQPMTLVKTGLPRFRLAIGAMANPGKHSIFQQLHNYPVGNTGKEHAPFTMGSKYNITPVRRGLLSGIKGALCLDGNPELEEKVRQGIAGNLPGYGIPFLGDNNFLLDRLETLCGPACARWYIRLEETDDLEMPEVVIRSTINIDRADLSCTRSALFLPITQASAEIPKNAWVEVGY